MDCRTQRPSWKATAGPWRPGGHLAVFTALLLDKALYETVYELRHRPDWVEVPAAAVRRALGRGVAPPRRRQERPCRKPGDSQR